MPLSQPARAALQAAVRLNPGGAKLLLLALRAAPRAVMHKSGDRLGPLGLMLGPPDSVFNGPSALARPPLPAELASAADAFVEEWLQKRFSKAELASEIERCLVELGIPTGMDKTWQRSGWKTVASTSPGHSTALDAFFPPLKAY